ncbi:unnamed protein product [Allacma fusca]|uniref:Mitochondrial import receptor subunit TOM40 n=1 Tax=Allacma fusca TaxID=39272 RepID=A0A8J2LHP2_9HEXA|nr:unnamed protein product [Allacma fusca]
MGNNIATLKTVKCEAVDPTIVPPPPPPGAVPGDVEGAPAVVQNPKFKDNPGTLEELHKKCKEVFPQPFEGAKVMINKGLNQGFQVSHSITLSSITPSGYRFGATYVGTQMVSATEPALVLMGEMDPSGNLNAQGVHFVNESCKLKFGTQILNSKFATYQFSGDWRGKDWTGSVAVVNPNLFSNSGIAVFHYLQSITSRIALGAELMYQQSPQIPGGAATLLSGSARFTGDSSVWSGYYGSNGFGLCYYRRLNEELQVGVEVENSYQHQQTVASLGYQFDIPKANFVMKAMVDTNWTVTGVFEKRLNPMPFTFALCGSLNHAKNQFRLGCGLTIGG